MRVLFVNPAGGLGGAERVLFDMLASLRDQRPDVEGTLLALESGDLVERVSAAGFRVELLPMPRALTEIGESGASLNAAAFWRMLLRAPGFVARFRRRVLAIAPDVVHTNGVKAHALAAVALRDRRLVMHLHDFASRRRVSRYLFRHLPSRTTAVAISEAVARDARDLAPGLRTRVVHNAVDVAAFAPGARDPEFLSDLARLAAPTPGTLSIGLIATYARWKGHLLFIQAAERLLRIAPSRPLRFYVVGGPIYATRGSEVGQAELELAVRRAGLESVFGFVPFVKDVARVYRGLDVVVNASTDPEPFGLTIVEGMASGLAVIAPRAGGPLELFEDGRSGVGFEAGNADDLAKALHGLVEDDERRKTIGKAARGHALACFDRARVGIELGRVYAELLGEPDGVREVRTP